MKISIVSRADSQGGAYIAAYRLHQSLLSAGMDSWMWVGDKYLDDYRVKTSNNIIDKIWYRASATLDSLPLQFYPQRQPEIFSNQWCPDRFLPHLKSFECDVVNLHWINAGYLQLGSIAKLGKPIVWTLHDMWAFTGGCHYAYSSSNGKNSQKCDRYIQSCGQCPILGSKRDRDLSRYNWQGKASLFPKLNLTLVTPSTWLADCVKASSLLGDYRVEVIPNSLDTNTYKPIEKSMARHLLNLPLDKQIILFGAFDATSSNRKGFHLLLPALQRLSHDPLWQDKIHLVVFGASTPEFPLDFGFPITYLGRLNDAVSLVSAYSAANVTVVPSMQESFGQTASESLSCGTPVVAYNYSGLKDVINNRENGYLAEPYSTEELAIGIIWVLEDQQRYRKLSLMAREQALRKFSYTHQASRYISLFTQVHQPRTSHAY